MPFLGEAPFLSGQTVKLVLRSRCPVLTTAGLVGERTTLRNTIETACGVIRAGAEEKILKRLPCPNFARFKFHGVDCDARVEQLNALVEVAKTKLFSDTSLKDDAKIDAIKARSIYCSFSNKQILIIFSKDLSIISRR